MTKLSHAPWQRCQLQLPQNAIHHAPDRAIRKHIGAKLRQIWKARILEAAAESLRQLVAVLPRPNAEPGVRA